MTDFKRDPLTGDIDISEGLQLVREGEEAAQRISLALDLNLGEWFLNINFGLPWIKNIDESFPETIQYMLGNKRSDIKSFIDTTLTRYLESQDIVRSVTYTSEIQESDRVYSYSPKIITQEGESITLTPFEIQT